METQELIENFKNNQLEFRAWNGERMLYQVAVRNGLMVNHEAFYKPDIILMQYIRMKDRKGQKLFEADIILLKDGRKEVVSWDNLTFQLGMAAAFDPDGICKPIVNGFFDGVELIGNIFQNHQLLKELDADGTNS